MAKEPKSAAANPDMLGLAAANEERKTEEAPAEAVPAEEAPAEQPDNAEAEAARIADEDAAILARQQAEEAALRAEADAMRENDALAASEAPGAILFDTSETRGDRSLADMLAEHGNRPWWLIFGATGQSTAVVPAQKVQASDFAVSAGQMEFTGEFETMAGAGMGTRVDAVALAASPDGPIVSLCEIAGGAVMRPGEMFKFGPGAFVFR